MKIRSLVTAVSATSAAMLLGQMNAIALPGEEGEALLPAGPDVIVGDIPDVAAYATGTVNGVTYASYAIGSTSCNVGTVQLQWQPMPSTKHPTIPQNMYRVKGGAIEQIGLSWCKHGFCALQQDICGTCTSAGTGCPTVLGIGCSDPYTASLNGQQSDLKSRGPINPSTGVFPANYSDPSGSSSGLPTQLRERLIVDRNDLNPSLNPGASYFAECQYIHVDDASAGNDNNNASYRPLSVGSTWGNFGYGLDVSGTTQRGQPGIYAWKSIHSDVSVKTVDVEGDGRFLVAYRVTPNGNGTWHYEYAIQNLNSDRAGGSFSVPLPAGVTVTNIGFKSPKYLNGEGYTNAAWTATQANGKLTWTCEPNTQSNANALRWATLYNFRFDANSAPSEAPATLGLWKAPSVLSPVASVSVAALSPSAPAPPCPASDSNCDGEVNGVDLGNLLAQWGTDGSMDLSLDGVVNGVDLGLLLSDWGPTN